MTKIAEDCISEIKNYRKHTLKTSFILLILLLASIIGAFVFKFDLLLMPLYGALLGLVFSTVNIFSLGYAYYALVLKNRPRWLICWPILSFLLMCVVALVLALSFANMALGYALGITAPMVYGAIIVGASSSPLDRRA